MVASGGVIDIFKCAYITFVNGNEATERGILHEGRIFLGYAPGIGIFTISRRR